MYPQPMKAKGLTPVKSNARFDYERCGVLEPYYYQDIPIGMQFRFTNKIDSRIYVKYTKTIAWDGVDKFKINKNTTIFADDYTGYLTCDVCACDTNLCKCPKNRKTTKECIQPCCLKYHINQP